jgi:hypothetical protein
MAEYQTPEMLVREAKRRCFAKPVYTVKPGYLPRQARDKHRNTGKVETKRVVFSAESSTG